MTIKTIKGYKVQWKIKGIQYETDYIIKTKKEAQKIADRIYNNMNNYNYDPNQGSWIVKI